VSPVLFLLILQLKLYVATSTEVERVFSQGRQLLHFTRNRLAPSSIRAYMCLGSWSRHDLLLMGDLLSALRPRKRKRAETDGDTDN
jgi:hAT family C-terminal dimerisation region